MTRIEKTHYWCQITEEFYQTGLSARAFCLEKKLNYPAFLRWKKRFEDEQIIEASFVEIKPEEKLSLQCGSLKLSLANELSTEALAQVIKALNLAAQ